MSDSKSGLRLVTDSQVYFHELVTEAISKQSFRPMPESEIYVVNLLKQFMTTDRLYGRDEDGGLREEPLALMLKDAIETPEGEQQKILFRQLGDVSLYVAGFFQDSLNRKLVDVDYYIDMGSNSYQQVAAREPSMRGVYRELSDRFGVFVDILAEVSDKTWVKSERNILRFYELWVKTRSERAARALQEAGILPNVSIKKSVQ